MKEPKLTNVRPAATGKEEFRRRGVMRLKAGLAMATALGLSACINVSAPEEPIVIELNIDINARILYELADSANNTIDENADIF